jgi:methionine sulfoxide reductase heme-binding subunit
VSSAASSIPKSAKPLSPAKQGKPADVFKMGACAAALVPLVVMGWRLSIGYFTDPVAEILNQTGLLGLILLIASLTCTPLKLIFKWSWPMRLRKTLGLLAFAYICLHFTMYVALYQFFDIPAIVEDIVSRPFITFGFAAFVILILLARTSTSGAIRRMGAKNWQRLHRFVYLAGALGIIHFIYRVKSDVREPALYGAVLAALLLIRLLDWLAKNRAKKSRERAA